MLEGITRKDSPMNTKRKHILALCCYFRTLTILTSSNSGSSNVLTRGSLAVIHMQTKLGKFTTANTIYPERMICCVTKYLAVLKDWQSCPEIKQNERKPPCLWPGHSSAYEERMSSEGWWVGLACDISPLSNISWKLLPLLHRSYPAKAFQSQRIKCVGSFQL